MMLAVGCGSFLGSGAVPVRAKASSGRRGVASMACRAEQASQTIALPERASKSAEASVQAPSRREIMGGMAACILAVSAAPAKASELAEVASAESVSVEVLPMVVDAVDEVVAEAGMAAAVVPEAAPVPAYSGSTIALAAGLAASFSACIAEFATFPVDTAKVRLQLQGSSPSSPNSLGGLFNVADEEPKYKGLVGTIRTIMSEEGIHKLYAGLPIGLQHQLIYSGLRLAIYDWAKQFGHLALGAEVGGEMDVAINLSAGLLAGATAILIANPTDVVRTRLQSGDEDDEFEEAGFSIREVRNKLRNAGRTVTGARLAIRRLPRSIGCYFKVVEEEGISALWSGVGPNVIRAGVLNSVELASYDYFTVAFGALALAAAPGVQLGSTPVTVAAATMAGLSSAVVCSPVDVIRSRVMHRGEARGSGERRPGMLATGVEVFRKDGPGAFYKGIGPFAVRLAAYDVVLFFTLENIRAVLRAMDLA